MKLDFMKVFPFCITFSALVLTTVYFNFSQSRQPLPLMENLRIVIKKRKRLLEIFDGEKFVRKYQIGLGFSARGDKKIEGDGKTPEGEFYVCAKNDQSKFYLSLGLSYPNAEAAKR